MKIITTYNDVTVESIDIVSAKHLDDYRIAIQFIDNSSRIIDFAPFLKRSQHPSIRKYLDMSLFTTFVVIDGNLSWNNNELIFPLEDLYEGKI